MPGSEKQLTTRASARAPTDGIEKERDHFGHMFVGLDSGGSLRRAPRSGRDVRYGRRLRGIPSMDRVTAFELFGLITSISAKRASRPDLSARIVIFLLIYVRDMSCRV